MIFSRRPQKGSILIFCLWTLTFLTVLSVQIGLIIRQRISLLSRIESRQHLRDVASAGNQKAISAIRLDLLRNGGLYTNYGKAYRHNNREIFKGMELGGVTANVQYANRFVQSGISYGFVDEERKVNVNTADYNTLMRLFQQVLNVAEEEAQRMALSVIDWREFGETLPEGFNSDEYYGNLEFPYEAKNAEFEVFDELALVQGFSPDRVEKLKPYLTVYGDGLININTASRIVLMALGVEQGVAEKIIRVRQGIDEEDATIDDYIFYKTFDVATEIQSFVQLEEAEIRQIDALNQAGRIKTNSAYFLIESFASFLNRKDTLLVSSVYNAKDNKIEYWSEK